jgi:hypothetical protein
MTHPNFIVKLQHCRKFLKDDYEFLGKERYSQCVNACQDSMALPSLNSELTYRDSRGLALVFMAAREKASWQAL